MATIYLMRHGIAHSLGEAGAVTDSERTLSPAGIAELEQQSIGFANLGERIHACYASPLRRAQQTAEIMTRPHQLPQPVLATDALGTHATWEAVAELLASNRNYPVLLVGHAPFIGQLMSKFVCGHTYAATPFATAAMCRIELLGFEQQPFGQLSWFMDSGQLQRLAPKT